MNPLMRVQEIFSLKRQPSHFPTHFAYSYRFPNNFGLFRDPTSRPHGVSVVWIVRDMMDDGFCVTGHKFLRMTASWEDDDFSLSELHSYKVSNIDINSTRWSLETLVGKGTCLYLGQDEDFEVSEGNCDEMEADNDECIGPEAFLKSVNFTTPQPTQHWQFDLLDHCINYEGITRKTAEQGPVQKRHRATRQSY